MNVTFNLPKPASTTFLDEPRIKKLPSFKEVSVYSKCNDLRGRCLFQYGDVF